jgi:hypothetical protein
MTTSKESLPTATPVSKTNLEGVVITRLVPNGCEGTDPSLVIARNASNDEAISMTIHLKKTESAPSRKVFQGGNLSSFIRRRTRRQEGNNEAYSHTPRKLTTQTTMLSG